MTSQRARRRASQKWRREHAHRITSLDLTKCFFCGGEGSHYIPPSLGQPGFFACDPNPHVEHDWVMDSPGPGLKTCKECLECYFY